MKLQHENLEDFEPLVRDIFNTAFKSGLRALNNHGKDLSFIKNQEFMKDDKFKKKFIANCHKGYDRAQKKIADGIFRLNHLKNLKQTEFVENRRQHKKEDHFKYKEFISVINNRILVLRRIIDSIAFTLIEFRPWIARRFILLDRIKNVSVDAIRANLLEARLLNEQDRLTFSLVCDLSTYIDIGDLIQIDLRRSPPKWRIIEIKKGKINKILEDIIEERGKSLPSDLINDLGHAVSKYAPKQASRMIRQKLRMEEVKKIVDEGEGIDIRFLKPIKLSSEETTIFGYDHIIKKNIDEARVHGFSASYIDDCLFLLAAKRSYWDSLHLLYHFIFPQAGCKLGSSLSQEIEEEKRRLLTLAKSHFLIDLVTCNMYSKSSPPYFFANKLSEDDIFDLLFGRLRILIFWDIQRFGEIISSYGFRFELSSKKETEDLRKELGRSTFPLYNNRAIRIKSSKGHDCTILGGILDKIFFEFMRPTELVRLWKSNLPI